MHIKLCESAEVVRMHAKQADRLSAVPSYRSTGSVQLRGAHCTNMIGLIGLASGAWFIHGTGRYFINPNVLIEATVMYANDVCQRQHRLRLQPHQGFRPRMWSVSKTKRSGCLTFRNITPRNGDVRSVAPSRTRKKQDMQKKRPPCGGPSSLSAIQLPRPL